MFPRTTTQVEPVTRVGATVGTGEVGPVSNDQGHDAHIAGLHNDGCIHCGLDYDFEMPEGLVDAAHGKEVVIFAGAGISTEVPNVFPDTVLDIAARRIGVEKPDSFPETLEAFQQRFGRAALVRMVKDKFDYIDGFVRLRNDARKFHRELATMPYLCDVVTTNWDLHFEEECGATPFVTGEDIALYDMPGRRVLKVHGSMSNLASIVATESDYAKRLEELNGNVMGGLLRHMLATRTVVFIGYSLRDWNFRRLYSALRADMADFAPRAYIVTPFGTDGQIEKDFGLTVINTSGVRFLKDLKTALVGPCFIDDSVYDKVEELFALLDEADQFAKSISHKKYPAIIHCWAYHDGLRDAFFRITHRRPTGEYSDRHNVLAMLRKYDSVADRAYDAGRYTDAAYIEGYTSGLMVLMSDQNEEIITELPLYLVYASESAMRSQDDLLEALELSRRRAPKERKEAREYADRIPEGMVRSHAPFLPHWGYEGPADHGGGAAQRRRP